MSVEDGGRLRCSLCHDKEFEGMDEAVDHLEGAHAVVTNTILENTEYVDDETGGQATEGRDA